MKSIIYKTVSMGTNISPVNMSQ